MKKKRLSLNEYPLSVRVTQPIGKALMTQIETWMVENVGVEEYDWRWHMSMIAMDNVEDMLAFKLKFGL
jgi:hypothetical protein